MTMPQFNSVMAAWAATQLPAVKVPARLFSTLMGEAGSDPATEEKVRLEEIEIDRRRTAIQIWLQAYAAGELTLESLGHVARKVIEPMVLSERSRRAWFGYVFESALAITPPARGRGNKGKPSALRSCAVEVVELVIEREQVPVNRASGDRKGTGTAFERAAAVFKECGVALSPREIERWYYKARAVRE